MVWIKNRILAEKKKHEASGLDWARIAEAKIVSQLKEDLMKVHRKSGIHIPLEIFGISEDEEYSQSHGGQNK